MESGKIERIRERAYEIWEREGRPHGRDDLHWRMAEEEIAREEAGHITTPEQSEAPSPRRKRSPSASPKKSPAKRGK